MPWTNLGRSKAIRGSILFRSRGGGHTVVWHISYDGLFLGFIRGGDTIEGEVNGRLEIRNAKFRYPNKPEVQVLKGVSLSVDNERNRVVALCGTSGCGKSSLISLIERFYDPEEGEVLFNGRNIKELDPRWYHNQIAIVQ